MCYHDGVIVIVTVIKNYRSHIHAYIHTYIYTYICRHIQSRKLLLINMSV